MTSSIISELSLFLGQALIISVAFAILVMGLGIFFKWLPKLGPNPSGIYVNSASSLFDEGRFYDVILSSGHRLTNLQFEGMVQTDNENVWALRQLAVMRHAEGGKVILKIDSVRVFEEVPQKGSCVDVPFMQNAAKSETESRADSVSATKVLPT